MRRKVLRGADDIDIDEGLIAVDAIHSEYSVGSLDRQQKLAMKMQESARRHANELLFPQESRKSCNEDLCCVCENCGYVFYRKDVSEFFSCPHCQARHHFEPAELVSFSREEQNTVKLEKLVAKERDADRRRQFGIRPAAQDTSVNDAKNQSSLQMGSPEYREYLEDIQEQAPDRPDDAFHEALERHNVQVEEQMDAAGEENPTGDLMERKAQSEAAKREIHDEVMASLAAVAARTATKADDRIVGKTGIDNPVLHDVNVSSDEYAEEMELVPEKDFRREMSWERLLHELNENSK